MIYSIIGSGIILLIAIILFIQIKNKKVNLEQQEKKKKQIEQNIDTLNIQLEDQQKDFQVLGKLIKDRQKDIDNINNILQQKEQNYTSLLSKIDSLKEQSNKYYNQQKEIIEEQLERFKKVSSQAAENYFDELQKAYEHADAAHTQKMTRLKEEQDSAAAALNKIVQTRNQAYQALLKEKEIKQNKDSYRLLPSRQDLEDIYTLEHIKQGLHKPRILSMLIWQTYFQPLAKKQFPIILKDKTKIGIYKITNIKTDESYIGQSVDVYKRWSDHCKAGLGIDTPVGNKLYKAMLEYGLENFTFELLCECFKEQLDEKERYFIELYQADLFGYNGTKGNK